MSFISPINFVVLTFLFLFLLLCATLPWNEVLSHLRLIHTLQDIYIVHHNNSCITNCNIIVALYTTLWEFVMMCIESEYLIALQVTTTNQQTTVVGKEPLQTLRTFRAGPQLSNIHAMRNGVSFIPVNIWMSFI